MGAKFLDNADLGSREECLRLCCETDGCDVFVFEEKVSYWNIFFLKSQHVVWLYIKGAVYCTKKCTIKVCQIIIQFVFIMFSCKPSQIEP